MKTSVAFRSLLPFASALLLASGIQVQAYLAPDSFFDVFLESSTAPPYPASSPVQMNIGAAASPFVTLESVSLRLKNVTPAVPTRIAGSDSGGGGGAGLCSFFDIWMEAPTISSFFDIFLEMATPVGPLPVADKPTVVWHTDSFFDVYFECEVPGQGRQFLRMEFRIPEGQTARFAANPTAPIGTAGVDSFFDIFLGIIGTGPGGQLNLQLPAVRVVMTGNLGWPQPSNPGTITKFKQWPDSSVRGVDVLDCPFTNSVTTLLADDFICTQAGPISDIHLWGSWLNDRVDAFPTFWLGIWSDVPATNGNPSHPGTLLWSQMFAPGQYQASVQRSVPFELFLDPNQPPKILGQDHQIWKYDFFPKNPFRQTGSAFAPKVYWVSAVAMTSEGRAFGWKTTTDHFNDYAVFATGMIAGTNFPAPLTAWQVITDHQGRKRELAFELTSAQRWACNKDFWNPWPYTFSNVRVILPRPWGISGSFNGFGGTLPQFADFDWTWNASDQTVMDWSGGAVAQGEWVHIGFEGPGVFPPFVNWGWWSPYLGNWSGWIPQVSIGWQTLLLPTPTIGFTNILPIVPGLTNHVFLSSLSIEYYTNAVPLETLNRSAVRSPIRTDTGFAIASPMLAPGSDIQVSVPAPPAEATHAVVIPQISPVSVGGDPNPQYASVDWAMIPLTETAPALPPPAPVLQVPKYDAGSVTLTWTAQPGAIYRVQSRTTLMDGTWTDEEGDVIAAETTASKTLTAAEQTSFYRVVGMAP